MNEKQLTAYLWDDAPTAFKEYVAIFHGRTPQMLWIVPARWRSRAARGLLPPMLRALIQGYAGHPWGFVERWRQPDGSLYIVVYQGNATGDEAEAP